MHIHFNTRALILHQEAVSGFGDVLPEGFVATSETGDGRIVMG